MAKLFTKLTEEFDSHAGEMMGYVDVNNAAYTTKKHYDIRSFHTDDITVPRTMIDMNYWNSTAFDGTQMAVLDAPRIVQGRSIAARQMSLVDVLKNQDLNQLVMKDLDLYTVTAGNENWPIGDAAVTVGKDATERYANTIAINLISGVQKTVASSYRDNILTDFQETGHSYYIEIPLPGFPAQGAASYLDLANSYIDFSSDAGYAAGATDSIPFSSTLNSVNAGGNTYLRFNRNLLTKADLSNLTNIRFRLQSVGNMTFKAQNIRLVRDDYAYDVVDIDTKRSQWRRSVPRDSGTEPAAPSSLFMTQTKPKNVRVVAKFNAGHLDAANANVVLLNARKSAVDDSRIYAQLQSLSGSTTLLLRDRHNGVDTTINTTSLAALTPTADYYLVLDVYENKATASIYTAFGAFFGTLVGTTGAQTTTVLGRGYIGFDSQPYNYDFALDYVTVGDTEFARFEGTSFGSLTPVTGATISGTTSLPVDLGEGHYVVAGDATLITEPTIGLPAPSVHFTRDGTGWQGGYMTDQFLFVGNPKYLTITGDIYPVLATGQTALRGEYRVVLLDKNDAVGYIGVIRGLLPSQWNSFTIHVNANFAPGNYRLIVQQTGFYADQFYLDNLKLNHLSIAWEASPNGGTDWFPFLSAVGTRYSGVNMITKADQNLKLRAIALSDLAWVADYEAIPKYGFPGRGIASGYGMGTYGSGIYGS